MDSTMPPAIPPSLAASFKVTMMSSTASFISWAASAMASWVWVACKPKENLVSHGIKMASIDPLAPLHNYTQTRSSVYVPLDATSCKFADVLLFPCVIPYGFLRPLWQRTASVEPTQTGFWFDLVCSSAAGGRHVSTPVPLTPQSLAQSSSLTESPEGENRRVNNICHANIQFLVYFSGKSDIQREMIKLLYFSVD